MYKMYLMQMFFSFVPVVVPWTLVSIYHPHFTFYCFSLTTTDIVMEDAPPTPNAAAPATQPQAPPTATPSLPPSPAPDRDAGRRGGPGGAGSAGGSRGGEMLGLTKEVLSAHTQQEEQNFMYRFRDLSELRVFDPASAVRQRATAPLARGEDMHNIAGAIGLW